MSLLAKRLYTSAVAGALLLAAAACADKATAPAPAAKAPTTVAVGQIDYSRGGRYVGDLSLLSISGDTARFTVDPTKGGWFSLADGHYVYFPANAICDLSSPYGPGQWDSSCTRATQPIAITAVSMKNGLGMPYVNFQPAMRFAPSTDQSKWVWLFLYDQQAATTSLQQINYCFDGLGCYDESVLDPTLVTHRASGYPYLYRRVKHFSGYNVAAGFSDTDASTASY